MPFHWKLVAGVSGVMIVMGMAWYSVKRTPALVVPHAGSAQDIESWMSQLAHGGSIVVRTPLQPSGVHESGLRTRPLTTSEVTRLASMFEDSANLTQGRFRFNERDGVAYYRERAASEYSCALARAQAAELRAGSAYVVLEGAPPPSPNGWMTQTVMGASDVLHRADDRKDIAIPIQKSKYPDINRWREEKASLAAYQQLEWMGSFNNRSFEERAAAHARHVAAIERRKTISYGMRELDKAIFEGTEDERKEAQAKQLALHLEQQGLMQDLRMGGYQIDRASYLLVPK